MKDKRHDVDPGPYATLEQAQKAKAEALELLQQFWPLNLPYAAKHIEANPPSADAIAMLPFVAHQALTSARYRALAKLPRNSLHEKLKRGGFKNYAEVRESAPEIAEVHSKKTIAQALSRIKKKKKLP